MRPVLLSLFLNLMAFGAQADDVISPLSVDPDLFQLFRVVVDHTGRSKAGGDLFAVIVTPIDAIDGLEPEITETRYVAYLRPHRTPMVMAGVNDVVSQAVWPFCRELFGADQFATYTDAVPSSVSDSFTASGVCFQGPM